MESLNLDNLHYTAVGDEIIKKAKLYGSPVPHFQRVAAFWSVILNKKIKPSDVTKCMQALKVVREEFKHNPDNILDMHGYGLLTEIMLTEELVDAACLEVDDDIRTD